MGEKTPIEDDNVLLEGNDPLTSEQKSKFAYFGENAKILPPYRILNPQNIIIGDFTAIREGSHINAFRDLSFLKKYIDPAFQEDFSVEDYKYSPKLELGREIQIGRFFFVSCTAEIVLDKNVLLSERVFLGDNNHTFSHREVPIMQQPNKSGEPIHLGQGSWVGVGAVVLGGTKVGKNSVIGANSVCKGVFPDYSVIGPEPAKLLYRRFEEEDCK